MVENMFDMIPVRFGDRETLARPFDFIQDADENFVAPIKGITTCPYCGHGQEVDLQGKVGGDVINLKCFNCGAGEEDFIEPEKTPLQPSADIIVDNGPLEDMNSSDIEKEILAALAEGDEEQGISPDLKVSITIDEDQEIQTLKSSCPFIDPIELGLFQIDEL